MIIVPSVISSPSSVSCSAYRGRPLQRRQLNHFFSTFASMGGKVLEMYRQRTVYSAASPARAARLCSNGIVVHLGSSMSVAAKKKAAGLQSSSSCCMPSPCVPTAIAATVLRVTNVACTPSDTPARVPTTAAIESPRATKLISSNIHATNSSGALEMPKPKRMTEPPPRERRPWARAESMCDIVYAVVDAPAKCSISAVPASISSAARVTATTEGISTAYTSTKQLSTVKSPCSPAPKLKLVALTPMLGPKSHAGARSPTPAVTQLPYSRCRARILAGSGVSVPSPSTGSTIVHSEPVPHAGWTHTPSPHSANAGVSPPAVDTARTSPVESDTSCHLSAAGRKPQSPGPPHSRWDVLWYPPTHRPAPSPVTPRNLGPSTTAPVPSFNVSDSWWRWNEVLASLTLGNQLTLLTGPPRLLRCPAYRRDALVSDSERGATPTQGSEASPPATTGSGHWKETAKCIITPTYSIHRAGTMRLAVRA
eukprot:Hpha_TRINITY_DN1907_c0_g1::TRINITY_DN1907_c0_g1_i1::g.30959::m.30959